MKSSVPRPVKYMATGQGRDSYIFYDNGGLSKPRIDQVIPRIGYQIPTRDQSSPENSPKKNNRSKVFGSEAYGLGRYSDNSIYNTQGHKSSCKLNFVRYYGNGGGRDTYIIKDFGGMIKRPLKKGKNTGANVSIDDILGTKKQDSLFLRRSDKNIMNLAQSFDADQDLRLKDLASEQHKEGRRTYCETMSLSPSPPRDITHQQSIERLFAS